MKKLLLLSFLIFGGLVNAQWVQQHSNIYQIYNTMFFIDSLNGYVGGHSDSLDIIPFILKTSDGGETWNQINTDRIPYSIDFPSSSTGFHVTSGKIYKTTDGGSSWNMNYQEPIDFNSVQFLDKNNGFVVGGEYPQNLCLLKTYNSGLTWNKSQVAIESGWFEINMIDELTGFIINEFSSKIYKTTDGGSNWNVVYNDFNSNNSIWDISFSNELNGFAGGPGVGFISTSDGGTTWNKRFLPITYCTNIFFKENHCWVSGFDFGYSAIVYSDDYGNTWTPVFFEDSSSGSTIPDIFFTDLNKGWCILNATYATQFYFGTIFKIENDWLSNISVPSIPQQIFPENNFNIEDTVLNFEWERLAYSLTRFQVSTDSLFNSFYVLVNPGNGDTTFCGNQLYIENNKTVSFPLNQKYYWRVRAENLKGVSDWSESRWFTTFSPSNVDETASPVEFKLSQNYPNPFNPISKIVFTIPSREYVLLKVYDILGSEITTLINKELNAGKYEVDFSGKDLSSGIYIYQIKAGTFRDTKKMILIK